MHGLWSFRSQKNPILARTTHQLLFLGLVLTATTLGTGATPIPNTQTYPIPGQPGVNPANLGGWTLGDLPPANSGITSVVGWAFIQSNIYDSRTPLVDVHYLAVRALVKGKTVTIVEDDYGTASGRLPHVGGDWTPRSNYGDPSLEVPAQIVDSWSPGFFTVNSASNLDYGIQIWNIKPGAIPAGATKIWAEMDVRIGGSGIVSFGFDFYGPHGYVGNAGYSGFHFYLPAKATPAWQIITFGLNEKWPQ